MTASHALSQLSYGPTRIRRSNWTRYYQPSSTRSTRPSADIALLEPGKLCRVSSAKPKRSIGKDPLAVYHVPDKLLDAPLAFFVAPVFASIRNASNQRKCVFKLLAQYPYDVAVGHTRNVAFS